MWNAFLHPSRKYFLFLHRIELRAWTRGQQESRGEGGKRNPGDEKLLIQTDRRRERSTRNNDFALGIKPTKAARAVRIGVQEG